MAYSLYFRRHKLKRLRIFSILSELMRWQKCCNPIKFIRSLAYCFSQSFIRPFCKFDKIESLYIIVYSTPFIFYFFKLIKANINNQCNYKIYKIRFWLSITSNSCKHSIPTNFIYPFTIGIPGKPN